MPFTYEEKCFVKIHRTICMAPNSPDLSLVDYAVYKGSAADHITFRFPAWAISETECAPAGTMLTNSLQIIDKSIDHWRDKLKAVI